MDKQAADAETLRTLLDRLGFKNNVTESSSTGGPELPDSAGIWESLKGKLGIDNNIEETSITGGPALQEDVSMMDRPLKDLAIPGAVGLGALGLGGYGAYKLSQGMRGSGDEDTAEEEEMAKASSATVSRKDSLFVDGFFDACYDRGLAPESAVVLLKEAFAPSRSTSVGDITQRPAKYVKQAAEFRPTTLTRPFLEGFYRTCYDQGLSPEVASQMHKEAMTEEYKVRNPAFEKGYNQTMYKEACSRIAHA